LDLIGQARHFYQYAAELINQSTNKPINPQTEDSLAYLRTEREFKNLLLVELPRGDWAQTILRQFLFSQYQYLLFQQLQNSNDEHLAAIALKSLKEVTYHVRWSSEWVIRLGDGTEESNSRLKNAVDELWNYTGEFFETTDYELQVANQGIGVDVAKLKVDWMKKVTEIFVEATISISKKSLFKTGGKNGIHSEHLETILTDLQYLQRTYPGAEW
jgi:ring-1,2-phenylacetyl-CoA epoxidase subunit PaaC